MRVFVAAVALVLLSTPSLTGASAEEPNRAGIVVSFGDHIETRCVEFAETEISGAELLSRAGFSVVASSTWGGGAMCMIDGTGCAAPGDCWCQCHGSTCRYWAYYTLEDGEWHYSSVGAAQRKAHDGDVDGWAWGPGSAGSGAKPRPISFDEICGAQDELAATPTLAAGALPEVAPGADDEGVSTPTVTPAPTITITQTPEASPTALPSSHMPAPAPDQKSAAGGGADFPWQLPAFGTMAVGLLGVAFALMKRRSGG